MGNTESATSDEDEIGEDLTMESNEVIKVFQPRKLRDELENGKEYGSFCKYQRLRFLNSFHSKTFL